ALRRAAQRGDAGAAPRRPRRRVGALRATLDAQQVRLAEAATERVQTISGRSDLAAQANELVGFLRDFGDYARDEMAPLIEAHVANLDAAVIQDGRLTREGLRERLPAQVDELAVLLDERDAVAREIDAGALAQLDWMVAARRWYTSSGAGPEQDAWFDAFAERELVEPLSTYGTEWKRLLAFQYQLRERTKVTRGKESTRLFASFPAGGSASSQEEWLLMKILDEDEGLFLERTYFDVEGQRKARPKKDEFEPPTDSISIEWRGKSLMRLTDLPDHVTFVEWNPTGTKARSRFESLSPKSFRGLNRNVTPSSLVLDQYLGSGGANGDALICLEVEGPSGSKYLLHPVLGVVRHESARYDYELVHLQR
ncbi:MAG: hypothetical protein AAF957_28745, partial [Planctomycetota bacterium]